MLGWIKKKWLNEQKKFIYQNRTAIGVLTTLFEDDGSVTSRLQKLEEESWRIFSSIPKEKFSISSEDASILLEMNKELRGIYDKHATSLVQNFDDDYKPPLGWDEYYKSWED